MSIVPAPAQLTYPLRMMDLAMNARWRSLTKLNVVGCVLFAKLFKVVCIITSLIVTSPDESGLSLFNGVIISYYQCHFHYHCHCYRHNTNYYYCNFCYY